MTSDNRVKGPETREGEHPIRLSAMEFAALMERTGKTVALNSNDYHSNDYHFVTIFPVTFWVARREWEEHNLRMLLHNCAAKWKDVLTEPTLQKLRAILDPPKEESTPTEDHRGVPTP